MKSKHAIIPPFLANFAENQVINNVLPFWQDFALSSTGGVYGAVSQSGRGDESAPQGAILSARTLWSFSHAYELTGDLQYLKSAEQLFKTFKTNFVDEQYGGVYWSIDSVEMPLKAHKHVVAQAYAIFSVSLYYQISQDPEALLLAKNLIGFTRQNFFRLDRTYLSKLSNDLDGHYDEQNSLIETCNQLHMLEAITQYIKSTQDTTLNSHLEDLIDLFLLRIFPAQAHLALRFSQNWIAIGKEVSYGHNFEAGYLVYMACELLADNARLAKAQKHLLRLVDFTIKHCKHESGNYRYGFDIDGKEVEVLFWWPQTEASNALILAAKLTDNPRYINELVELWGSIENHWVDHQHGEWFSQLDLNLKPAGNGNKADFWRCSYHTTRACFHLAYESKPKSKQTTLDPSTHNFA